MDVAECINGRGENHVVTHGPECFYCGQIPTKPFETMRTALEAIQELHKPQLVEDFFNAIDGSSANRWKRVCVSCDFDDYPCATRKLADEGLDRMARTNQGENND